MDETRTDYNEGRLYLLDDGSFRFVGRLTDVREGPGNIPLLEMEVFWAPRLPLVHGTRIPCLISWVVREAVPEDYPDD